MTFQIISQPVQPQPDANITLQLYSTELSNNIGGPILHTRQNGTVILYALSGGSHDVAVTNLTSAKTVIGQGYCGNLTVTVQNQGNSPETFNVTAYANTTSVASQNVTLSSGTSTTLTFTWNTTGFAYGNYTISAYAMPVPDETDTADNAFAGGTIKVSCIGDIDGTYSTTMLDYQLVKNAIPSTPGGPKWNPNADINNNGAVNMLDFQLVKIHVGQHV
jgi:hypothetical protein